MKKTFLTLLLILSATLIPATEAFAIPHHYFTRYSSDSGLPNSTITCCLPDSKGFVWVGTKEGIYRFDSNDFIVPDELKFIGITDGVIGAIGEDADGIIWFSSSKGVGTYDPRTGQASGIEELEGMMCYQIIPDQSGNIWLLQGDVWARESGKSYMYVCKYNKHSGKVQRYFEKEEDQGTKGIVMDSSQNLWLRIASSPYLYVYNPISDKFESIKFFVDGKENDEDITNIAAASGSHLLVSTEDRNIYLVNTVSNSGKKIMHIESKYAEIRAMLERDRDEYWIGTADGIYIYDKGETAVLNNDKSDPHSLSGGDIWKMAEDGKGNVWVGTFYNGLNLWQNNTNLYSVFYQNQSQSSLSGQFVRGLCQDRAGNLWIGTEDGGLNKMDLITKNVTNYYLTNDNGERLNIQWLAVNGPDLWITTLSDGIYIFDIAADKVRKHYRSPLENTSMQILPNGDILLGSRSGLYAFNKEKDSFEYLEEFGYVFISCILSDSQNGLWIGTDGQGLWYSRDAKSEPLKITVRDEAFGLTSDHITSLYEDSRHRIWVTTEGGGVCQVQLEEAGSGTFTFRNLRKGNAREAAGMPSNVTSAVAEDNNGNIWISTSSGIIQVNPDRMAVKEAFLKTSFIIGDQYSYGACFTARDGDIYFGTNHGLFEFSPAQINNALKSCPIYITDIWAEKGDKITPLHTPGKSTAESSSIEVRYRDITALSIKYAMIDISMPFSVVYNYSLKKGKKVHSGILIENNIRFVDLSPGHYTFNIKRLDDENEENARTLSLYIKPPFYRSILAYILYFLATAIIVACIVYRQYQRRDAKKARQVEKLEADKQKEIYKAKLNFFTNITHEFRTPLTLIKIPIDKIISKKDYTESSKKDLLIIQENTNRLLTLSNQVLDMKKMDKNETRLRYVDKDITKILRHNCALFEQNAADQHFTVTNDIPEEPVVIPCAEDVITTVMNNLLSNAFKYGKDAIEVKFEQLEDKIRIRVNSNGNRIAAREAEKIFEMFYQLDNDDEGIRKNKGGAGLGLPYARSMARLHNGDLFLDTAYPEWNSFVFELPMQQAEHIDVRKKEVAEDAITKEDKDNSHYLLVVEDDSQMRSYICNELSDEYNITSAANGEDALKIIQEQRVDLVISDIMMPVMDGCQLCNKIKSSTDYSHIPVILLTAAVGVETRIETLQVGADGYIEKPFSMELLRATISNLFKNKEIAYNQFVKSPLTHYNSTIVSNVDQEYMDKLHNTIISNLSDSNLNVDSLAEMMNMSKSTLYRKVKSNTGLNVNEYIRLCRLKQAAEMLSSQKYRVNEVADIVGFSSPSYFATCFQKQFNVSPSNFVKQLRGKE